MSLLSIGLAAESRAANFRLRLAGVTSGACWTAVLHATACAADLERAERLADLERSSALSARDALDRALALFDIEQAAARRADEAALDAAERPNRGESE